MVWRMAVRGIFASKFYGWREAVRSAPRAVLANIIAIMAARRAMLHYIRISRGKMPVWEKTTHHFPTSSRGRNDARKNGPISYLGFVRRVLWRHSHLASAGGLEGVWGR